ncbi:MAG: hypothetical protein KDD43_03135 [Bdellovibrionales bacterium]|nr:hypothetical protein [Bdellovibrionales bacterium]
MQNLILALALAFFMIGCSFKDSAEDRGHTPQAKADTLKPLTVTIFDLDQSTELIPESEFRHLVKAPYPFPVETPEAIKITLFNLNAVGGRLPGVRVKATFNESTTELPVTGVKAQPIESGGGEVNLGVTFDVHGLRNLLPKSESREVSLEMILTGEGENQTSILVDLQTPPSAISVGGVSPDEYYQKRQRENIQFREILTGEQRFILVRVLEITNHETKPVEIILPQRGYGSIHTNILTKTYEDLGCDFRISEERNEIINQGPFEVIPLSQDTFQFITDRVNLGDAFKEALSITLKSNERVYLGLFGSNSDTHTLFDEGIPKTSFETRIINTTCHKQCFKKEVVCDPSPRDPIFGIDPQSRSGTCQEVCVDERVIRGQQEALLGSKIESVQFIPSMTAQKFSARFPSTLKPKTPSERSLSFMSHFPIEGIWGDAK